MRNVIRMIKSRIKWTGNVACMANGYQGLVVKPGKKRPRGVPSFR